jgi:hypothetical protein
MHFALSARIRPEQEHVTACRPKRQLSSLVPACFRLGLGLGSMLLIHQNPCTSRLEFGLRKLSGSPFLLELTNLAHKFSTWTVALSASERSKTQCSVIDTVAEICWIYQTDAHQPV